ncbi:ABC-2 type transporter [Fragilaria crotonensis]|nr:ABC-2 type transporter [Fragilaria crotonensis]
MRLLFHLCLHLFLLIHFVPLTFCALPSSDDDDDAGIHWNDLRVTTAGSIGDKATTLVDSFSGSVSNGQACGIIGPSGAGKSTFLSALAGTASTSLRVHGHVWLRSKRRDDRSVPASGSMEEDDNDKGDDNDNDDTEEASLVTQQNGQVAFLQQQDSFFHLLTVRETMELAAYLEYPNSPKSKRSDLIDRTLDALGLASVAHRHVGEDRSSRTGAGLSGGERRRLSVGLELLSTPRVFFADESTTGLDSSQAVKIVKLIVDLAKERQIPAILTLHQPRASIWKMLDSFILMAPGGRVCYAGPRQSALIYFRDLGYDCPEETNPAEFFIDLVSVDTEDPSQARQDEARIHRLARAFQASQENLRQSVPFISRQSNSQRLERSPIRRFGALLLRSWRQNIRNTNYNLSRLIACLGCSALFSQIFKSVRDDVPYARSIADRTALLSFGVINMCMMALLKTVHLFSKERAVVKREQMRQQYSSLEYLLSKVFAEIPMDTAFAAIFTTVLKAVTGLHISWTKLTTTFSVMTAAGASLGFAIGSCAKDGDTAMAMAMPIMVLFMVVGVINPSGVDKQSSPPRVVKLLQILSPIKWAIEAVLIGEFQGIDLRVKGQRPWEKIRDLPKFGAFAMVQNGDQILASLGLDTSTYNGVMKHMALLALANLCLSWIGLELNRNVRGVKTSHRKTTNNRSKETSMRSRRDTNSLGVVQVPVISSGL